MSRVRIRDVAFIGIVSDDPAVRRFYVEDLGLEALEETDRYLYLRAGPQARLEILAADTDTAAEQSQTAPSVGFLVDDIHEARSALTDKGIPCGEIKRWASDTEEHLWFYLSDPAANTLLLLERRDGAAHP